MGCSPLMMLDMLSNSYYSLSQKKELASVAGVPPPDDEATLVGSSHGWLALFNECSRDFFLWNPISGRRINLPPIDTLPIPAVNLKGGYGCVDKVIVSSSSPDAASCRAVMTYGPELRLAFCCPATSTDWSPIGDWFHNDDGKLTAWCYEDFAYSTRLDRLFCITQYRNLERWDLRDPSSPRIDGRKEGEEEEEDDLFYSDTAKEMKYVVVAEESDEVFIVARNVILEERAESDGSNLKRIFHDGMGPYTPYAYTYKTAGFDVFRIIDGGDDGKLGAVYVEVKEGSLNGLAMFVGGNSHSFALPASEFPELKPNSIYFTDAKEILPPESTQVMGYGGNDVGIFDYEKKEFYPCYYPLHVDDITSLTPVPIWFTPASSLISKI